MTKIPSDDILEGLYKLRIRESEKLKTVLELCNMEIHQKKAGPDYHRLKTMVKEVSSRIYELRILRPKTEIMKEAPWSRIRGQHSVYNRCATSTCKVSARTRRVISGIHLCVPKKNKTEEGCKCGTQKKTTEWPQILARRIMQLYVFESGVAYFKSTSCQIERLVPRTWDRPISRKMVWSLRGITWSSGSQRLKYILQIYGKHCSNIRTCLRKKKAKHGRNPNAPTLEDRDPNCTARKKTDPEKSLGIVGEATVQDPWKFHGKRSCNLQTSPIWATASRTLVKPEKRESIVDSGASTHMMSKTDLSPEKLDTLRYLEFLRQF